MEHHFTKKSKKLVRKLNLSVLMDLTNTCFFSEKKNLTDYTETKTSYLKFATNRFKVKLLLTAISLHFSP